MFSQTTEYQCAKCFLHSVVSLIIWQNGKELDEADRSRDENGYWQTSEANKGREYTRLTKTTLETT